MIVSELRGFKSLRALNAFHALMLGLKMLPSYVNEPYEKFFDRVAEMPPADQEKLIREAVKFVELDPAELEAIISFVKDKNGVPYGPHNIKNLSPLELVEIVVAVCKEIAAMRIDSVTESEKKN
jgi:hypothetical protein